MASVTATSVPSSPSLPASSPPSVTCVSLPSTLTPCLSSHSSLSSNEEKLKAEADTSLSLSSISCHSDTMVGVRTIAIVDPLAPSQICIRLLQQPGVRVVRIWSCPPLAHHTATLQKGHQLHFDADIYHHVPIVTPVPSSSSSVSSSLPPSSSPSNSNSVASISKSSALEHTLAALRAHQPPIEYVLAAVETGVELADQIADGLQLRGNGISLSAARRDKYIMQDTLRAAGLRSAHQMLVTPSTEWSSIMAFCSAPQCAPARDGPDALGQFRVVIKPVRSSGGDGVTCCTTYDDVKATLALLLGHSNKLGGINNEVVMQEYLDGVEHVVDSVSSYGVHKTVAVWQYHKGPANGARFNYFGMNLLCPSDAIFDPVVTYTQKCLDALGIHHGPTHAEVMMSHDGPCLVEVGARFHGVGASFMMPADECIGYNQVDVTVDMLCQPSLFYARPSRPLRLYRYARQIFVLSPVGGRLKSYPGMKSLMDMKSVRQVNMHIQPDQLLYRTVDGWTSPGNIILVNDCPIGLYHHYMTALKMTTSPSFYDLDDTKDSHNTTNGNTTTHGGNDNSSSGVIIPPTTPALPC